ncbi:OprD family outer membrane porin [Pseudomonas aeruginosa]
MKVMKWSAIALAVSAGSTQFAVADAFVSDQAEAKGFIEDSSLDLLLRNYYFNRDGKSGSGDRVDWTQGFLTTYESGFTQGTVGFGVDAFGYLGLKLDGTKVDSSSSYAGLYGEDGKHHETNLEAKYVVQAGPAKDLSFRIRQAWHRANADEGEGDQNEFRLIVDYPLSIL